MRPRDSPQPATRCALALQAGPLAGVGAGPSNSLKPRRPGALSRRAPAGQRSASQRTHARQAAQRQAARERDSAVQRSAVWRRDGDKAAGEARRAARRRGAAMRSGRGSPWAGLGRGRETSARDVAYISGRIRRWATRPRLNKRGARRRRAARARCWVCRRGRGHGRGSSSSSSTAATRAGGVVESCARALERPLAGNARRATLVLRPQSTRPVENSGPPSGSSLLSLAAPSLDACTTPPPSAPCRPSPLPSSSSTAPPVAALHQMPIAARARALVLHSPAATALPSPAAARCPHAQLRAPL